MKSAETDAAAGFYVISYNATRANLCDCRFVLFKRHYDKYMALAARYEEARGLAYYLEERYHEVKVSSLSNWISRIPDGSLIYNPCFVLAFLSRRAGYI